MPHDAQYFVAQITGTLVLNAAHAQATAEALTERVAVLEADLLATKQQLEDALSTRYTPPVRSPELVGSL